MKTKPLIHKSLALACAAVAGSVLILGGAGCEADGGGPGAVITDILKGGTISPGTVISAIEKDQERQRTVILSSQVAEQQVVELVQRAGDDLAARLPQIEGVNGSNQQKILAISSIKKADGASGDVEGALACLQTLLINNEAVAANFVVVDRSTTDAETIMQRVSGAGENSKELADLDDPLQRKASTTKKVVYHPDDIYVLSGKLYIHDNTHEVDNAEKRVITYQLTTSVIHARSGQIRLRRDYKQAFTWNKQTKKFVPAA